MAEGDTTQTTRSDPAGEEAARVAAAAAGSEQPTVIVDDPEVTGAPEGEEVVSGPPPTPAADPNPELEEEAAAEPAEAPSSSSADVVSQALGLGDLSRPELERLSQAVDNTLRSKGAEPAAQGLTLSERASKLDVNQEATKNLTTTSAAAVFKKDGVKPEEIASMSIRQEQSDMDGTPIGPAYLRIVTRGGRKLTAVHE